MSKPIRLEEIQGTLTHAQKKSARVRNQAGETGVVKTLFRAAVAVAVCGAAVPSFSAEPAKVIYRTVAADGKVTLSDRPLGDGKSVVVGAYATDPKALEAAQREREYWRQRSNEFAERARLRDLDLSGRRGGAALSGQAHAPVVIVSHMGAYSVYQPSAGQHYGDAAAVTHYTSQPGAASGRDAPFLGSGFSASGPRR